MRSSIGLNALLAVAVAVLGALIYFNPSRNTIAEFSLSALKPFEARSIRIERAAATPIGLEKKDGAWFLAAPFTARGDGNRVRALLEVLEARTPHRLPATELSRFELAPPRARLIVDGQSFGFGIVSPIAREQYVLTAGAVYAIHPRYGAALPRSAAELASHSLFGPGESPVRMQLSTFVVEQRDGKWIQTPGGDNASQEELIRWVDAWRLASALRVEPHVKAKARETIRVRLKSGGALALGVLAREPDLVLVRADENLQYAFRPELAKRLLSPPVARNAPATGK